MYKREARNESKSFHMVHFRHQMKSEWKKTTMHHFFYLVGTQCFTQNFTPAECTYYLKCISPLIKWNYSVENTDIKLSI